MSYIQPYTDEKESELKGAGERRRERERGGRRISVS